MAPRLNCLCIFSSPPTSSVPLQHSPTPFCNSLSSSSKTVITGLTRHCHSSVPMEMCMPVFFPSYFCPRMYYTVSSNAVFIFINCLSVGVLRWSTSLCVFLPVGIFDIRVCLRQSLSSLDKKLKGFHLWTKKCFKLRQAVICERHLISSQKQQKVWQMPHAHRDHTMCALDLFFE